MRKIWAKLAIAIAAVYTVAATPAMAQATRTWVSGVGDDVNPCSRTAPCKTFAGAISKTATRGEINCLDAGGFGAVTITKSITISCIGAEGGVLTSAGGNGVIINIAGTGGRVTLKGLDLEGLDDDTVAQALNGVRILSAFDVLIEDCTIHGFGTAGVSVETSTTSRVTISRSTLHTNALGVKVIATNGSGHVKVIDSLVLDNTSGGLSVDSTGTVGNDIEIINNRIFGPAGLIQTNGGVVRSFGGNVIPSLVTPAQTAATK